MSLSTVMCFTSAWLRSCGQRRKLLIKTQHLKSSLKFTHDQLEKKNKPSEGKFCSQVKQKLSHQLEGVGHNKKWWLNRQIRPELMFWTGVYNEFLDSAEETILCQEDSKLIWPAAVLSRGENQDISVYQQYIIDVIMDKRHLTKY